MPSINIILLNWNGIEDTVECLRSIEKLTYPNVTAIVVDNGSKDNQAKRIADSFPDAVVLPQKENLGFCGGCNVGIKYALDHEADYVMLLNNDTVVTPGLIEDLLGAFQAAPNLGAVSPLILEWEDDKVWFSRARWVAAEGQFRLSFPGEKHDDLKNASLYQSEFACGCCVMVPAEVFRKEGLLDERYFAFYDEAEWCARIRRRGLESYVVPSAVIYHKVSRSTPSLVSTYLLTRNRLLWMKENLSLGMRLKSFTYLTREVLWHLANLAGVTRKYYTKQRSRVVLRGYADYFRGKFGRWEPEIESLLFEEEGTRKA